MCWICLESPESIIHLQPFLKFSFSLAMLILMSHCVFTLILLQIPPVSLKIPHTNSGLSFSPGLLCFAAPSAQNMAESFWLSSFCQFLLSFVKEMSVSHYRLKPVLFAVFNNWRWKIGVVTLCVVILSVILIF